MPSRRAPLFIMPSYYIDYHHFIIIITFHYHYYWCFSSLLIFRFITSLLSLIFHYYFAFSLLPLFHYHAIYGLLNIFITLIFLLLRWLLRFFYYAAEPCLMPPLRLPLLAIMPFTLSLLFHYYHCHACFDYTIIDDIIIFDAFALHMMMPLAPFMPLLIAADIDTLSLLDLRRHYFSYAYYYFIVAITFILIILLMMLIDAITPWWRCHAMIRHAAADAIWLITLIRCRYYDIIFAYAAYAIRWCWLRLLRAMLMMSLRFIISLRHWCHFDYYAMPLRCYHVALRRHSLMLIISRHYYVIISLFDAYFTYFCHAA